MMSEKKSNNYPVRVTIAQHQLVEARGMLKRELCPAVRLFCRCQRRVLSLAVCATARVGIHEYSIPRVLLVAVVT